MPWPPMLAFHKEKDIDHCEAEVRRVESKLVRAVKHYVAKIYKLKRPVIGRIIINTNRLHVIIFITTYSTN